MCLPLESFGPLLPGTLPTSVGMNPASGSTKSCYAATRTHTVYADRSEPRRDGAFRDDFFYLLSSDIISIPPLRQRLAECPDELDELLAPTMARMTDNSTALIDPICERVKTTLPLNYERPGNVRELEQCVRRILLTYKCSVTAHGASGSEDETKLQSIEAGELNAQELLES